MSEHNDDLLNDEQAVSQLTTLLNHSQRKAARLSKELAEVRTELAGLKAERAYDTAPAALAGDALRDALTEALDRAAGDYGIHPESFGKPYGEYLAGVVMPIVGRAALAARSAFPARPFTMDHTFGYTPVPAEPERELRIQRTAPGTVLWQDVRFRGTCSHCSWWRRADDPDTIEAVFVSHACVNYPLTDETEGQ